MNAEKQRRYHKILMIFFAVQIPPALFINIQFPALWARWWEFYVAFLSIYALVSTHWSGMSASDAGVKAENN